MNETYKSIKYYAYDKKLKREVLLRLTDFIKSKKIDQRQLFFRNGWVKGAHVNIVYPTILDEQEDMYEKLYTHLHPLKTMETSKPDYEQYETYVKRLKVMEEVEEDVLPLEEEHQMSAEAYIPERNMIECNDITDYFHSTPFLVDALEFYYSLDKPNQLLFLAKLIVIFSNIENVSAASNQGIYATYYSLRSHMEGFIQSIKNFPDKQKQRLMHIINYEEEKITDFIDQGFKELIQAQRNGYTNTSVKEKEIFLSFEECIFNILALYRALFDENKIILEEDMKLENFLNSDNLSDYHQTLKTNFDMVNFNSKEFIVGRLVMNWFYELLPLFSISPLEKIAICNIAVKSVEKDKGKDYRQLLKELEINYKSM